MRAGIGGLVALLVISACMTPEPSADGLRQLGDASVSATFEYLDSPVRPVRYLRAGTAGAPRILFVHGSPGSMDAYDPFFQREDLLSSAELVTVDRPGYGGSGFGDTLADTRLQAAAIAGLLTPGTVVVGHSFGGTIAMRLAMDYPERVGGLVLVAPSLSSDAEKLFFFNKMFESKALNWMLPKALKVSNTEKLLQKDNLAQMDLLFDRVIAPTIIMHGTRDGIVPIEHSYNAIARLDSSLTTFDVLEGERHSILWSEIDRISEAILRILNRRRPQP